MKVRVPASLLKDGKVEERWMRKNLSLLFFLLRAR